MDAKRISTTGAKHFSYPVARIDAQDESYVLPLREYFETHGVRVVVNQQTDATFSYHIVTGDASYVKHIFSREHMRGAKTLGIVLGGGHERVSFSPLYKIVLAYPVSLTPSEVFDIFEFFFTEGKNRLDLRDRHETRNIHEQTARDNARVKALLFDEFKDQATPDTRRRHEKKSRMFNRMRAGILGGLIGVCLFLLPVLWYLLSVGIAGASAIAGVRSLSQGNTAAAEWNRRVASYWIGQGSFVLQGATVPLSWVGYQDILRGQQRLVSFVADILLVQSSIITSADAAQKISAGLFGQENDNAATIASDIQRLRTNLSTIGNTLGLAQAELETLLQDNTFPLSHQWVSHKAERGVEEIRVIRQSIQDTDALLSLYISLSGFREPQTYLLLFQNSMELRPTGGFIGSVGIATLEDGKLTNLDVQDVYTLDGQLKGHVDPPNPIRHLLGQEHWYLRDSNWDPDFKEAGEQAMWFYEKETEGTVDGVIGISTPFVIDLLAATGPIELPDYSDVITHENFYGKSMYYTQSGFFPGSTQKKDFLGSLMRALIQKVTSDSSVNATLLFRAVTQSLARRDIVLMVHDQELQSLIEHYAWAGRVPANHGCRGTQQASCTETPLAIVEANLGVNKVNYYVSRSVTRHVTIAPDATQKETVTLKITNSSPQQDGALPYRTYVRFLPPPQSTGSAVTVDGATPPRFSDTEPTRIPFTDESVTASGLRALGVALEVPAGGQRQIVLTYTVKHPLVFGESGAVLDVVTYKQPGVSYEQGTTTVSYPDSWIAGVEHEQASGSLKDFIAKPGQVTYNSTLTRDELTRIRFTKP